MEVEKIPCRIQTVTGIGAATCSLAVFFHVETSSPSQVPVRSGNSFRPKTGNLFQTPRQTAPATPTIPIEIIVTTSEISFSSEVHCQSIVRQLLLLPKREQL